MIQYTHALTTHVKNSLQLPDRIEFVDYRQTISGTADNSLCTDKVHISHESQKKVVNFILNTLSKKIAPPSKKSHYALTFSEALLKYHVFSKKIEVDSVKEEIPDYDQMPPIDDAISLAHPQNNTPAPSVQTYLAARYGINNPP